MKIVADSTVWIQDLHDKPGFMTTALKDTVDKNIFILNTDFTMPNSYENVFSQKTVFKNIKPYIKEHLEDIRNGKTKLVFLMQDFWATRREDEIDEKINSGCIHTYDIYNWVYPQLKELGILEYSSFSGPLNTDNVKQHHDFPIHQWNYSFSIYTEISDLNIELSDNHNKLFLWLNRRPRDHRIMAYYYMLKQGLLDQSFAHYTFHAYDENNVYGDPVEFLKNKIKVLFNQDIDIQLPDIKEQYWDKEHDPVIYGKEALHDFDNIYKNCWMHVISEYNCNDLKPFIDEKIAKSIVLKKPFIIFGDKNFLAELKRHGFRTFDNFWDESYDTLDTYEQRVQSAVKTIDWIKDNINWNSPYSKEMGEILEYNYNHYFTTYRNDELDRLKEIFK